jgi:plastocyanin
MKKKARRVSASRRSVSRSPGTDDKSFLIIAAGGFLLILIGLFLFSGRPKPMGFSSSPSAESAMMGKKLVLIKDYAFSPSEMTVGLGETVIFRNQDPVEQAIVAKDDSFKTETIFQGGYQSVTFDKPGTYTFYSNKYPSMQGTITVQ